MTARITAPGGPTPTAGAGGGGSVAALQAALRTTTPRPPVGGKPPRVAQPWGAGAVTLPTGVAELTRLPDRPPPAAAQPTTGRPTTARLKTARPTSGRSTARTDTVAAALRGGRRQAGRPAPGAWPVVGVFSIVGGAGVSSLAAALADRWAGGGRRVVLLDAAGAAPGLASDRWGRAGRWGSFDDAAGLAAAVTAGLRGGPVVVIDGPAVPDPAVLAAAIAAARPLAAVVIDLPARHGWLATVLPALGVDLAVMCCPARPVVLRAAADFLRHTQVSWPPVVWAVTGPAGRRARAGIAAGSDVTAGFVRLTCPRDRRGVARIAAAADAAADTDGKETE